MLAHPIKPILWVTDEVESYTMDNEKIYFLKSYYLKQILFNKDLKIVL